LAKITIINEEGQNLNRYLITPTDGSTPFTADLARAADITKQGTPFSDDTMGHYMQTEDLQAHADDEEIHIRLGERDAWNGGLIITATHTKIGTTHNLEIEPGSKNLTFLATADIAEGDLWTINGQPVTAKLQNGEDIPGKFFKAGCWVQFIYDQDAGKLNFFSGVKQISTTYAGKLIVSVAAYDGGSLGDTKVRIQNASLGMDLAYTPDALGKVSVQLVGNKTYSIMLIDVPEPYYGEAATQYIGFDTENSLSLQLKDQPDIIGFKMSGDGAVIYTDGAEGWIPISGVHNDTLDPGSWENSWLVKDIRPCLLKNGVVQYYLKKTGFMKFDYTSKENGDPSDIELGNDGDVMIEIPKIYYKFYSETDLNNVYWVGVKFSKVLVDESWCANAWLNQNGIIQETMYVAAYEGFVTNNTLRSLSNKLVAISTSYRGSDIRPLAQANGSGYWMAEWSKMSFLHALLPMLFQTMDSSSIGSGISGQSSASTTIRSGTMNDKPLFWGGTNNSIGVKFCGIENFWGNARIYCDGMVFLVNTSYEYLYFKACAPYSNTLTDYTQKSITHGTILATQFWRFSPLGMLVSNLYGIAPLSGVTAVTSSAFGDGYTRYSGQDFSSDCTFGGYYNTAIPDNGMWNLYFPPSTGSQSYATSYLCYTPV